MGSSARILIIDDEEVVIDSCLETLAGGNYAVATATNGNDGLMLFEELGPDMVFVDLKMPGISGFEVLERIHAADPTVVTVVITGYATVSSAVEAMKKGTYDFLPKPFTPDEFRLITQRGLEKRRLLLETVALRREKEILRENFAHIVSHELKAPLAAVQQNLFALTRELGDRLSGRQRDALERMKLRVEGLVDLIDTWLRAIIVDPNLIRDRFAALPVGVAVAGAIENVTPYAERKAIEIVAETDVPAAQVNGDTGVLTEAFTNIIGNAVKYSPVGSSVRVRVAIDGELVKVTVSDTGVGIRKEDLPFIFEYFHSGRPAPEGEQGCGLGLAVAQRAIEVHRGSISVDSEEGRGATFTIALPVFVGGN